MSAVTASVCVDGAIIVADGVRYAYGSGEVMGFAPKILTLPDRNMAIAWAGMGDFGHAFYVQVVRRCPSFDATVDAFSDIAWTCHTELLFSQGLMHRPTAEQKSSICIVGYSERRNAWEGYRLSTYAKDSVSGEALKPWQPAHIPVGGVWSSFAPDGAALQAFGVRDESDTLSMCVRLVCAARACSGMRDEVSFGVGGFVQVVSIGLGVSKSYITHRWPDAIGEAIDPSRGDALPGWLE